MLATIAKQFTFDAAHHIPTCPQGHKCRRLHGHTYQVELVLVGPILKDGFVVDYDDIARVLWAPIAEMIDHRLLNEIPGLAIPSTEHLAGWICTHVLDRMDTLRFVQECNHHRTDRCSISLARVIVRESSTTWCEVHPINLNEPQRAYFRTGDGDLP